MAGRGGPKLKEYRQHVTSVRHWLKEIEYEGLIVCEVYCGAFGNCQVILPSINTIMLGIDDAEDKMKWLVINVAKLEEEQRHLLAEEEKKKAELESVQRRKALNDGGDAVGEDGQPIVQSSSTLQQPQMDEEETAAKIKTAWDKITIPKLEKYSGYDHPRPLWLLMKDGQVLYELNSANPPKLSKMVTSILTNVPLTEKELLEMDFHPDPAAKKRRKKKIPKKNTPEQLAREARKKKLKNKLNKPEVVRPAEYIIQARIADIHKNVADTGGKHPLLVLYTKDAASDDFTYYGQCERIRGDLNPVYHKSFSFLKADVQPMLDSGADIELKFVLYDSEVDQISKEHLPTILGDAYVHLKSLVGSEGEGGTVDLKLKKHLPHPVHEKKSARKNKDKTAEEHKDEEDPDDHGAGILTLITKTRAPEGAVTAYKLNLSAKNLPSLNKDAVGVAPVQPQTVNPDGTPIDPALIEESSRRDYFIEFQLSDENALRAGSIGITENQHVTSDPVFERGFIAEHRTKDDRTLTFLLYDGLAVDERFFDGLTNGLAYRKELIATASIRYESFLLQRKQFKNSISLPWLDSTTGAQLNGNSTLNISADELNDDGTIEPFDPDEDSLLAGGSGSGNKEALPEKLELAISLQQLDRQPDSTKQPLVGVFVQTTSGAFEFLGQTERALPTVEPELTTQYKKTFLVAAPAKNAPAKNAGGADGLSPSDEISADTTYASFGGAGGNSSTQPTPRGGAVGSSNRTNIYKFVLYDAETDDYSKGASEILGESTIELSKELLAMGEVHQLTLLDKTSTPHAKTSLAIHIAEVGSVQTLDLVLTAGGLVKVDSNPQALPNPHVKVYTTHKTLGAGQPVLAGETEKILASTDPSFLGKIQVNAYSQYESQVSVVVYDSTSEEIGTSAHKLSAEHIIGEVSFSLSEFQSRSDASTLQNPSGQPQPVEFKLTKLVRSADPAVPPQIQEVNGGLAYVRFCDITPRPLKKKRGGKKKAKKLDENGEELSDDGSDDEENEDEEDEESLLAQAAALAQSQEANNQPKELTKEEKEFGTSPGMTDGSKIALSVGAQDIPKKDWLNEKYPFIALFKKSPLTGLYEFLDATERIRDENDPKWQKIFILENPQGSQFYKLILLDAPRQLSPAEMAVWANAQAYSRPGVGQSEKYETLTRQGGDCDHLGESIIDVQKLLIRAEPQRFQDRYGVDIPKTQLQVQAGEIGNINALQLIVSASGLPKSELFNKTDPLVVLSARNPNTGELNELVRTERLVGAANASWSTPLPVDGYSKADRELRFAVYDADQADARQTFTDKDLLGEASTTLNGLLAASSAELKLSKGGKAVEGATLTVRAGARGASSSSAAPGSRPATRPGSAVRQPTRPGSAVRQPSTTGTSAGSSSQRASLTRPLSAQRKLEQNLAAKDEEAAAAAIAEAEAKQAAATPAQAVAESVETAQSHNVDPAPAHNLVAGTPTVGPPAAADATMAVPTPGGITSATSTDGPHEV